MPKITTTLSPLKKIVTYLPILLVTVVAVPILGLSLNEGSRFFGFRKIPVPVVGTGSMYPSLYWSKDEGGPEDESKKVIEEYRSTPQLYIRFSGINIFGHTYFRREIKEGDIVAFKNDATKKILEEDKKDTSAGFIKRVIGVPGDVIELRDGFVYRNNALIAEPYIATPRSTYGGTTLEDCVKLIVPTDSYFVLGDNRKISDDSRFQLGLIKDKDIEYILPLSEQKIYEPLWRNTEGDAKLLGQPTLSTSDFVTLANQIRSSKKLAKLTLKPALVKSATLRGEHLLADKNTTYSFKQAMSVAGYSNIVLGEFVSYGHFTAQELIENLLYNTGSSKQLLDKDFTDLGIAAVDKQINGCPTEVIVGHLGGYIPASYDPAMAESWRRLRDNLRTILPSWEKAVEYNGIDQGKLAELLTILHRRLALAEEVVAQIEQKAWFTDSLTARITADTADEKRAEVLANELNKQ